MHFTNKSIRTITTFIVTMIPKLNIPKCNIPKRNIKRSQRAIGPVNI